MIENVFDFVSGKALKLGSDYFKLLHFLNNFSMGKRN